MRALLAFAYGSPCPTLVLDARGLPVAEEALPAVLKRIRAQLVAIGEERVLKLALLRPSAHPSFDLRYRFVQCLPGSPDRFDAGGACAHSALAAAASAHELGFLPRLAPGSEVRVEVANGQSMHCEVTGAAGDHVELAVQFLPSVARRAAVLPTGETVTRLGEEPGHALSIVSAGNVYAFADAAALGLTERTALFADDAELKATLTRLRAHAARRLGLPTDGAFPKIAAVGQYAPGRLAVRALSVPTWHPTLALTGSASIAVASAIPGTIPNRLARDAGCPQDALSIDTPGGTLQVTASVAGAASDVLRYSTGMRGRRARLLRPIELDGLPEVAGAQLPRPARTRRRSHRGDGCQQPLIASTRTRSPS